jgi:hypothetical protein
MQAQQAIIVAQTEWFRRSGLAILLLDDPNKAEVESPGVRFVAFVIEIDNAHGLLCRSVVKDTPKLKFSRSEVLIPWKYIEAVAWTDDLTVTTGQVGFGD